MSWLAKLLPGCRETVDERLHRMRHETFDANLERRDRVGQLEDDLYRARLLVHSLVETCVQRGVFSREELNQVAEEIDGFVDDEADAQIEWLE